MKKQNNTLQISFIVPIFNTEKYLRQCIESLLAQQEDAYEIILINDGSTDKSEKICKKYTENHPEIRYIKTTNQGLSAARNTGLAQARGRYVWFIDSDDYIDPQSIEKIKPFLNHDIIAINHYDFVDDNNRLISPNIIEHQNAVKQYLLNLPAAPFKIFRKSFLQKNNFQFPSGRLFEDLGSIYSLTNYTNDIYFSNLKLYYCRKRKKSITHSISSKHINDRLWAADQVLNHVPNKYSHEKNYIIIKHIALYTTYDIAIYGDPNQYRTQMDAVYNYLIKKTPKKLTKNPYIKSQHGLKNLIERIYLFSLERKLYFVCKEIAKIRQKNIGNII